MKDLFNGISKEDIDFMNSRVPSVYFFIKNTQDAEDIIQDSIIKLSNNYHKIQGRYKGEKVNFMKMIIRNTMVDFIRTKKRKMGFISYVGDVVSDDCVEEYDDQYDQLSKLLEYLPADQLNILNMRLTGKSFKEISKELGLSINTVLGMHRYARISIEKMVQDPSYRPARSSYITNQDDFKIPLSDDK